ncbi:hypothetical protein [Candidatus Regiella endosymbiont of Tuberolachnus salignus]|uniref:hypothetical protein n=1 Tax=Candidatus Regiella endosymbiont of Tuberolachnus salignus TaxID=3077956 RepID=UPI0030CACFE7
MLTLSVPKECSKRQCFAVLKFAVYDANPQRVMTVNFLVAKVKVKILPSPFLM